jgi:Xaa-Pro dipeptidase
VKKQRITNYCGDLESTSRKDPRIIRDSEAKLQKLRSWLAESGFDALIIARRENFAWLTCGGDSAVVNSTQNSVGCLLLTKNNQFLISHVMDGKRLMDEQITFQSFELIEMHWYEGEPVNKALEISGKNTAADINFPGTINVFPEILDLHYPMTELEMERLCELGQCMHSIFIEMSMKITPGISELDLAAEFHYLQNIKGISSDVLIVGSDERIIKYRHPMPTNKKIEKFVMLHSASRKWGLHAPITRLYSIGTPEEKFLRPFQSVMEIQAKVFENTKPGVFYSQIMELMKDWYAQAGYPEEWKNHFQGGPTGYVIVDSVRCLTQKIIQTNTPFEWFITVPGSKTAELSLLGKDGLKIVSNGDFWPQFSTDVNGVEYKMPGIYII